MKRKKAILNLARANSQEVIIKANTIISKMTGNAAFPSPAPALSAITAQVTLFNNKITEQQNAIRTAQQKTVEMQNERDNLINLLEQEANYVETAGAGDEAKILSAGFDVKKTGTPLGLLPAPVKVLATEGPDAGQVLGSWQKVAGARSYIVEMSYDISNPDNWSYQETVTKTRYLLSGLESGIKIWIRVAAINAAGRGAYSDPATKTVP